MKLWLAGKTRSEDGRMWEFVGVYTSESLAVAACTDWRYFVAPINLNDTAPDDVSVFPGASYPIARSR